MRKSWTINNEESLDTGKVSFLGLKFKIVILGRTAFNEFLNFRKFKLLLNSGDCK